MCPRFARDFGGKSNICLDVDAAYDRGLLITRGRFRDEREVELDDLVSGV